MNFLMTVAVIGAMIISDWLEGRTMNKAPRSIADLIDRQLKLANVITHQQTVQVPVEEVQIGQLLAVKPGEQIPVDGKIDQGNSFIDLSTLIGKISSLPWV
jgi:Cu+-exporting ATPase